MRPEEIHVEGLAGWRFRGARRGPPVVVVHGTMDRASGFRRTARHLEGVDVTAYDRRGYAGSRGGGSSAELSNQLDDLETILDCVGGDPAVVVGHSFGGLLALHLAARAPERLAAIGVWEPPVPWFDWYRNSVGERARGLSGEADPARAAEIFMRGMIGDRLWDRLPASMKADRRAEGPALLADLAMAARPDAEVDLAALAVPTVAACGGRSAERFRRSSRLVGDEVPEAELVIVDDADHGIHLQHPAEFAAVIRRVLARAGSRA